MLMPSSEQWGGSGQYGKYSVKIYTIDGVLIYQVENGTTNTDKTPLGGVIVQYSVASSMTTTIANPITYYGSHAVINQAGHSKDLYNYYWTSYSRGTDGRGNPNEPSWHNAYLDGYIPLRVKSIYDPCPYLYRIPSNGTYNQFRSNPGWTIYSYLGGVSWNMNTKVSWFLGFGRRAGGSSIFEHRI